MKIVALLFRLLPLSMAWAASPKYMNWVQWMQQRQQTFALGLGSECKSRI
jgi:hypothetical protein